MQTFTLDLKKNPEIAALASTMEPGDTLRVNASIKAKDDQTLTLTVDSVEESDGTEAEVTAVDDTIEDTGSLPAARLFGDAEG